MSRHADLALRAAFKAAQQGNIYIQAAPSVQLAGVADSDGAIPPLRAKVKPAPRVKKVATKVPRKAQIAKTTAMAAAGNGGRWSKEEDATLREVVAKEGAGQWKLISV
jgi:hypothetical protein